MRRNRIGECLRARQPFMQKLSITSDGKYRTAGAAAAAAATLAASETSDHSPSDSLKHQSKSHRSLTQSPRCLRPPYTALRCIYATSLKPKFQLARLDSTRLDTFDFVERVEPVETSVSSETSRAVPTWRTTNKL